MQSSVILTEPLFIIQFNEYFKGEVEDVQFGEGLVINPLKFIFKTLNVGVGVLNENEKEYVAVAPLT